MGYAIKSIPTILIDARFMLRRDLSLKHVDYNDLINTISLYYTTIVRNDT